MALRADILSQIGCVIGVSKRCCPTCRIVISKLMKGSPGEKSSETRRFFVERTHSTMTGCSVLDCLPDDIRQRLAIELCEMLREELALFISPPPKPGAKRHRKHKSMDSLASRDTAGIESSSSSDAMSSSEESGESDHASDA